MTAGCSMLPAKYVHLTGFLCHWSISVECCEWPNDPAVGKDTFRQHLMTCLFASYTQFIPLRVAH